MRTSKRGYPKVMDHWHNAPTPATTLDQWASQPEAAARLEINLARIGLLIANGHLHPATSPTGEAGVTTTSLADELNWRRDATFVAKVIRAVRDTIHWF